MLWKNLVGNLVGNSCMKILWEILVAKSCRKILREVLVGKSYGKFLRENLVGNCFRKILWENLVGNSCGKMLWENLVGNLVGNSCGKFPIPISKPFLKVIFKICNSSRSTSFSLVNVKNSFLKPILNRFSHMTHQTEA